MNSTAPTPRQTELMKMIIAGNPDGSPLALDQIQEKLDDPPTKQAIASSLKALERKGWVVRGCEKRTKGQRGKARRVAIATERGRAVFRPTDETLDVTDEFQAI